MNPSIEDVNIVQSDKLKRPGQQMVWNPKVAYKPHIKRSPVKSATQNRHT